MQVLQDLFYVSLHVLFYLCTLLYFRCQAKAWREDARRRQGDARSLLPRCADDAGRTAENVATTTRSTVPTPRRPSSRRRRPCSPCPPTPSFCVIVGDVELTSLPWRCRGPAAVAAAAAAAVTVAVQPVMETMRMTTDVQLGIIITASRRTTNIQSEQNLMPITSAIG